MTEQRFHHGLWEIDIAELPDELRALAVGILNYVRSELGGKIYHRTSKSTNKSDRQTLVKHFGTGYVCLVISIIRDRALSEDYSLRLDFFDKSRAVRSAFFEIVEAPGSQWEIKGERRFFVPIRTPLSRLLPVLIDIWKASDPL